MISRILIAVLFFGAGYFLGKDVPVKKECPSFKGKEPISSVNFKDGEFCTYSQLKGIKTLKVKL